MLRGFQTHHIGVLVEEIPSAIERYEGSLGYMLRTGLFHDPLQTAFVQFLALPGDSTLLELIAPDGPQSRLTNALKRRGGIHHICYSISDLPAAISAMQQCGHLLIHPPQPAVAFNGRSIAWLLNHDHLLIELAERGSSGEL